jgi:predicted nucleic acid-binding protein
MAEILVVNASPLIFLAGASRLDLLGANEADSARFRSCEIRTRRQHRVASLPLTDRVVDLYGVTRAMLEARGISKSDFDLLIACTALALDAVLVTNDQALLTAPSRAFGQKTG